MFFFTIFYVLTFSADRKTEMAIRDQKRLVRQKLRSIPFDLQEDIISLVVENPRVYLTLNRFGQ